VTAFRACSEAATLKTQCEVAQRGDGAGSGKRRQDQGRLLDLHVVMSNGGYPRRCSDGLGKPVSAASLLGGEKNMIDCVRRFCAMAAIAVLLLGASSASYGADVPSDKARQVLLTNTFISFNDANMTNNYSVLLARSSKQFQSQLSPEKLSGAFKPIRDLDINFAPSAINDDIPVDVAEIDNDGVLTLAGTIEASRKKWAYRFKYIRNENSWKIIGLDVDGPK
jgi:hypothetical protein